jgi:hypothetical protein
LEQLVSKPPTVARKQSWEEYNSSAGLAAARGQEHAIPQACNELMLLVMNSMQTTGRVDVTSFSLFFFKVAPVAAGLYLRSKEKQ